MLERLKNVSNRVLKSQKHNKRLSTYFLFFIISFSFWFLSMLSKQHETTMDIPISFSNFPADLIPPQSPPDKVSIELKLQDFQLYFIIFLLFQS